MFETLQDIAASIVQPHDLITQASVAIVITIGLLMCALSAIFPLRSQAEPDWSDDVAPWPMADSRGGNAGVGGEHSVVGFPNSRSHGEQPTHE